MSLDKNKPKKTTKPPYKKKEKPRKIEGERIGNDHLQQLIFDLFQSQPTGRFDPKHVITLLGVRNNGDSVASAMEKLAEHGLLEQVANGRYKLKSKAILNREGKQKTIQGVVDMTMNGAAFIEIPERKDDIFVSERNLNFALDGDTVEIAVFPRGNGKRVEGEVIEIVKRAQTHFIGLIHVFGKYAFVLPDKEDMHVDIFVPLDQLKGAKNGEKVVVKVVQWHGPRDKNPIGVVETVLGEPGSSDIAMQSILINAGFNLTFPEKVISESEQLSADIGPEELAARADYRGVTTFTIDPENAKDFDDALSYRIAEDGSVEVGVHIADVSHYVRPSSAMDEEAYKRSTSVYLVDRVLPMLPEKISNELCSLRPNEDKRAFSAIFVFDKNMEITDKWFGKTYIHSNRRFSYEEAQTVLETGEGDFATELLHLNTIAKHLRKAKFKNGAINFESPEVRFRLDESGKPLDVYVKERKDAHLLIEDFMLLANKSVAEYIEDLQRGQAEIPFVYRAHDEPDEDRLTDFGVFAQSMGVKMLLDTPKHIAESFNRLATEAQDRDELKVLMPMAIRTMAKAEYTTQNIGHYGLAFSHYSHFTSPIRRYSDVLAHRILYKNLLKPIWRTDKSALQLRCKHISTMERKAMDAERQSIKYKQAEYLENRIGDEFDGIISGLNEKAIFVELKENFCEGKIAMETLKDDFYFLENTYTLRGQNTKKIYRMGDTIRVKITEVEIEKRRIMMVLV
jgi:ribonuclease R